MPGAKMKTWTFSIGFLFLGVIGVALMFTVIGAAISKHGFKEREDQFERMIGDYNYSQGYIRKLEKDLIFVAGELRTTDEFIFDQCSVPVDVTGYN